MKGGFDVKGERMPVKTPFSEVRRQGQFRAEFL